VPVDRTSQGSNQLDRDELNALRGINKGLLIQTISPEHTERLKILGYVRDILGVITITAAGKAILGK